MYIKFYLQSIYTNLDNTQSSKSYLQNIVLSFHRIIINRFMLIFIVVV